MQQLRDLICELDRSLSTDAAMTALALVLLIVALRRPLLQWLRDRCTPRLTASAAVEEKRSELVTRRALYGSKLQVMEHHATFRLASGARVTFRVEETDYAQLTEGARGELTYRGTRFHGFARKAQEP